MSLPGRRQRTLVPRRDRARTAPHLPPPRLSPFSQQTPFVTWLGRRSGNLLPLRCQREEADCLWRRRLDREEGLRL